jgi:NTE family protein
MSPPSRKSSSRRVTHRVARLWWKRSRAATFTLVLGGGGARGLAHIGVLKVLEEEGLLPAAIVGTSMGAIVGGMYAQRPDAWAVENRMRSLIQSRSFQRIGLEAFSSEGIPDGYGTVERLYGRLRRGYGFVRTVWAQGIVQAPILMKFLGHLLDDVRIEQSVIPFAAVSCDLNTGSEVICNRGPIIPAVAASSAIPGIVSPVNIDGRSLVDGGPTSMVPVEAARRLWQMPIVAVTVSRNLRRTRRAANAIDVVLRAGAIARMQLTELNLRTADVVLRPRVDPYGWANFASYEKLIAEGERAARAMVGAVSSIAASRHAKRRTYP